jgi:asparagine synthase (glutamine-hydrolysing)
MLDTDCDWVLTYNGEIFNYATIRDELSSLGWKFRSSCDTEVVLKAWEQWGIGALQRFNGMFAFAAVNKRTGEMWLVRDRFGVKPLLWAQTPAGELVFSSSLGALAQFNHAKVNLEHCAFGLRFKVFETSRETTAFRGINSLAPGSWLHVRTVNSCISLKVGQWYNLNGAVERMVDAIHDLPESELIGKCSEIIRDAVFIRLRSDVPLAITLSGGLDSSTVASIAAARFYVWK